MPIRSPPLEISHHARAGEQLVSASALLEGQQAQAVLADKAYARLAAMKAEAVIPSKRSRKILISHDVDAYKHRNQIDRCFGRLKHFRSFAARYDRRTTHVTGFVHLSAAMVWLR